MCVFFFTLWHKHVKRYIYVTTKTKAKAFSGLGVGAFYVPRGKRRSFFVAIFHRSKFKQNTLFARTHTHTHPYKPKNVLLPFFSFHAGYSIVGEKKKCVCEIRSCPTQNEERV